MALNTSTSSSSSQATTASPQAATGSIFGASQTSGGVQPGTASSLLNSTSGVSLRNPALSTISLGDTASTTSTSTSTKLPSSKHHVSAPLLAIAIIFILVAAFLAWTAQRSVNKTT